MFGSFNVIALHGSSQTGEIFRTKLEPLIAKCSKDACWSFPDGTVAHDVQHGDSVARRSWYLTSPPSWKSFPFVDPMNKVFIGFSQGAIMAIAAGLRIDSCRLVIAACAPDVDWLDEFLTNSTAPKNRYLKIILLVGETDLIVPPESTKRLFGKLKDRGIHTELRTFQGNHYFPVTPKHLDDYKSDVDAWQMLVGSVASLEAQNEELQVLRSIYDDLKIETPLTSIDAPGLKVSLKLDGPANLYLACPSDYYFESNLLCWVEGARVNVDKLKAIRDTAVSSLKGEMQMFAVVAAVKDAVMDVLTLDDELRSDVKAGEIGAEEVSTITERFNEEELDEAETLEMVTRLAEEARKALFSSPDADLSIDDTRQGHWQPFCVGLLGKPSAGKSSFFNACTQNMLQGKKEAEEGAQPFTTIDPNLGTASCRVSPSLKLTIAVKDVAGLVPGAYKGLGKGNKFLNDLLDADALLHICDGSGSADDGGKIIYDTNSSDAQVSRDALWILREVHLWIYGNVSSKWPQRKKGRTPGESNALRGSAQADKNSYATRVCQLFAGYHAPPSITIRAAKLAGLDLEKSPDFDKEMRHKLCAYFIAVRFPVILVLNKWDQYYTQVAPKNLEARLRGILRDSASVMGNETLVVCASARVEKELLDFVAKGDVEYDSETGQVKVIKSSAALTTLIDLLKSLNGHSGVHEALVRAVKAAHPLVAEAVVDRERRAFVMYPGSTVYNLYETCLRAGMVSGDFVRAEDVTDTGATGKTLARDASLRNHKVVKIATNKRVTHQSKIT